MKYKFLSNLILLLGLNLLVKPFYILGVDASVQNAVGSATYGAYFEVLSFTFLLNILTDFGINNFNNRNIAQYRELLSDHFPFISTLRIFLAFGYFLISFGIGFIVGFSKLQLYLLVFLLINQILAAFILYYRSNLTALFKFKQDSIISILDRTLLVIMCSVLLWGGLMSSSFQIEWFVYLQTIAYAITAVIALLFLRKHVSITKYKIDVRYWKSILKKSWPYATLILLMFFYTKIDAILLGRMLPNGDIQLGIYAQGYRFLEALNNFSYLFIIILFPLFSRMLKLKEDVEHVLLLAVKLLIGGLLVIAVAGFFYKEEIIAARYSEYSSDSAYIFGLLLACVVAMAFAHLFGTLLTAAGKLRQMNIMAFCGVIINISLNLLLIPTLMAKGSAIAALITHMSVSIIQIALVQFIFKFKINYKVIASFISFTFLLVILGYYSSDFTQDWRINFSIVLLSGVALSWITGLFSPGKIITLLAYQKR